MDDGARLAWLREEVARLGEVIAARPDLLVSFDPFVDGGAPYLTVVGGVCHWVVKERGVTIEERATADVDEALYWSFESTTFSMACDWEVKHRAAGQDSRIGVWAKQQELLSRLDPRWVQRWRRELIARVADAQPLLPPI